MSDEESMAGISGPSKETDRAGILPVLKTKLNVPPRRKNTISRPTLVACIEEGIAQAHKLVLLSAPAGFGKSTLLSEWAAQTKLSVAWLSLDEGDNDITRFITYLIASLRSVFPDIGIAALDLQRSPQPPPVETVLILLINELVGQDVRTALVLDDYHLIGSDQVHSAVHFLIENLPEKVCLILASRAEPPLSVARLRGRVHLTELSELNMRFTLEEARAYLQDVMHLDLSLEDIEELEKRTEGWIVGLQMAALSMQGRENPSSLIQSISGTHRFILDYLVEEVLLQQPPDVQEFMLKTSPLEQISAPLCADVLGEAFFRRDHQEAEGQSSFSTSQAYLEHLERANLFIIPLDADRRWYRYHGLFSDLLQSRLEQAYSDFLPDLHRRASAWYEQNGMLREAVRHLMMAADYERAARLVAKNALSLVYEGNLATLAGWLDALPPAVKEAHPWLSIAHAWALTFAGQLATVPMLIRDAEDNLARVTDPIELKRLTGIIDALRAYLLALRGSMDLAAEFAGEALKLLPREDLILRGFSATLSATVLRWKGDLDAAADAYEQAIAINEEAGEGNLLLESLCDLAALQAVQGSLRLSMDTCQDALAIAEKHLDATGTRLPAHGYACIRKSDVLREWNDLEEARRYARLGLELSREWGQADLLVRVYIHSARVLQACGDDLESRQALQEAKRVARDLSPWYINRVEAWEADLALECGLSESALKWAEDQGDPLDEGVEFHNLDLLITLARVRILSVQSSIAARSEEQLKADEELLDRLQDMAVESGAGRYLIEILLLKALHWMNTGGRARAMDDLEEALRLAEPEGYARIFLRQGKGMRVLLQEAGGATEESSYVRRLLAAFGEGTVVLAEPRKAAFAGLVEPLSEREMDVLRLLPTHLTSPEIADELCIAVTTVRSHIKSIYGKLQVHSRGEAVEHAREIGVI
jgi:LuxR family maltose regulon positive regulatory protein